MSIFESVSSRFQPKYWLPAIVASLLLVATHAAQQTRLLGWDEVDYTVAAKQGFTANYLDTTALTAPDFIQFTKAKLKNQPSQFGSYYQEENDVFLRRHMHPPLMQYLINATGLGPLTDGQHDRWLFAFQLAGGLVLIALVNTAVISCSSKPLDTPAGLALAACSFLAAFHLTGEIQYHLWFAITFILVAFGLGSYLGQPSPPRAAWLGGLLALSFLALETGLFAFAFTLFLIGLKTRPEFNRQFPRNLLKTLPWKHYGIITAVMALTIFLLWPASVLKLSLPRILSIYAYRIYLGDEYAGGNRVYLVMLWRTLPLVLAGGLGPVAFRPGRGQTQNPAWLAFAGLGLCYGLFMLKFMLNITYMIPALTLLATAGLAALAELEPSKARTAGSALLVLITAWVYASEKPVDTYATHEGMQNLANLIEKHPALIEAGHLYKFYLPSLQSRIENFNIAATGDSVTVRKNMKYEPVPIDQMKNHLVLFYNRPNTPASPIESRIRTIAQPLNIPGIYGRAYLMPNP